MSVKYRLKSIIIYLSFFIIMTANCIIFTFSMDSYSKNCIGEYFNESITTIIKITTNKLKLKYRLINPDGETIDSNDNKYEYKTIFYPKSSGVHQMCLENYSNESNEIINVSIHTGVAAKDYNKIAKYDNLKPIDIYLIKLKDQLTNLIKEFYEIFTNDINNKNENQEKICSSIIYGSLFIVIFMMVVNFIEFSVIKNYIEYRRLI